MQSFEHLQDFAAAGPSFRDAEVHRLALERAVPCGDLPSLEFVVHAWNMTDEVTPDGYYRLTHHHLITFRFEGVETVEIDGFNHQNVLSGIVLSQVPGDDGDVSLSVELEHCYGVSASFVAKRGRVVDVTACGPKGEA
jgi:hypothetical protein